MAQETLPLCTWLLTLCSLLATAVGAKDALFMPLRRKDGGLIARGLLRNATLPLHGAVKDYGCAFSPKRTWNVIALSIFVQPVRICFTPAVECAHSALLEGSLRALQHRSRIAADAVCLYFLAGTSMRR